MTRSGQANNPSYNRFRKQNRPPAGEPWAWQTEKMLTSPAWRSLPHAARKIVDRVVIEHMRHGGNENGRLPVTYDDFEAYGIRRSSIGQAILIAIKLGWIDIVVRGVRGSGIARRPHQYGLTWLPRADFSPATNRWKGVTQEMANAVLADFRPVTKSHVPSNKNAFRQRRAKSRSLKPLDFPKRQLRSA